MIEVPLFYYERGTRTVYLLRVSSRRGPHRGLAVGAQRKRFDMPELTCNSLTTLKTTLGPSTFAAHVPPAHWVASFTESTLSPDPVD